MLFITGKNRCTNSDTDISTIVQPYIKTNDNAYLCVCMYIYGHIDLISEMEE